MPRIELFSAGCPLCRAVEEKVRSLAGPECQVHVHDLKSDGAALKIAEQYGIQRVPSVVIDGRLAACCTTGAVDEVVLKAAGLGSCRA